MIRASSSSFGGAIRVIVEDGYGITNAFRHRFWDLWAFNKTLGPKNVKDVDMDYDTDRDDIFGSTIRRVYVAGFWNRSKHGRHHSLLGFHLWAPRTIRIFWPLLC